MSKEIYTERSLWGSIFSPGPYPAFTPPVIATFQTPRWMTQVMVTSEPPVSRYVRECRNPGLIQRLLECGRDETIRRLLFLPKITKETQTNKEKTTRTETQTTTTATTDNGTQTKENTTTAKGTQTTSAVSEMGNQTASVSTADGSCQTATMTRNAGLQTRPDVSTADSQTEAQKIYTTAMQTTTEMTTSMSQTPVQKYTSTSQQTIVLQSRSSSQQTERPRDASVQCQTAVSCLTVCSQTTMKEIDACQVATSSACCQTTPIQIASIVHQSRRDGRGDEPEPSTAVSPYSTPLQLPRDITTMVSWSPTPKSLSVVAPDILYVGLSPIPTGVLTCELWTPWTEEEMARLAQAHVVVISKNTSASVSPAKIQCPTLSPTPVVAVEHTTTVSPAVQVRVEDWVSFAVMGSTTPRNIPRPANYPRSVAIVDPGRLEVLFNNQGSLELVGPMLPPVTITTEGVGIRKKTFPHNFAELFQPWEGGYGIVFRVRNARTPAAYPLVCKQMSSAVIRERCLLDEIAIMDRLRRTAVTPRLYGVVRKTPHHPDHNLLMEYIPDARELGQMVQDRIQLHDRLWLDILVQIVAGVRQIHQAGVLHNDLKYNNILVATPAPDAIKVHIIDFGVSTFGGRAFQYDQDQPQRANVAPEVYRGEPTSMSSDVFGIGGIVMQVNKMIHNKRLIPLMLSCMDMDPGDRPTTGKLLNDLKHILKDM